MHHVRYSRGIKAIAIILQTIFVVIATIGLSVCFSYSGMMQGTEDMMDGKKFIDSDYYESMVEDELYELAEYVHLCSVFETDGEYDSSKPINVENYVKRNVVEPLDFAVSEEGWEMEGIYYCIEDLIQWGREGLNYENIQVDKDEVWSAEYKEEIFGIPDAAEETVTIEYTNILEESAQNDDITISENTSVLSEAESDEDVETLKYLDEYYLPVDGVSLVDRIHTDEERQQFYGYLESAIGKLATDYVQYKTYESKFNSKNTNLRYAVVDMNLGVIYTNESRIREEISFSKEALLLEDFVPYLKPYGTYFFMNSVNMGYDSNLRLENEHFLEIMRNFNNTMTGNYYIAVAVDYNFPVRDSFYTKKIEYDEIQPWYRTACVAAMVSTVVAFALFVYITFAAGHVGNDEEVVLNWFDHIKTEIAALLMIGLAALEILIIRGISIDYQFGFWNNVIIGVIACIVNLSFLVGYLTLVRRIKKETLWKNSICYGVVSFVLRIFHNRKIATRTITVFSIYIIVNGLLVLYGILYGNLLIGLGVPVAVSVVAGIYIVRDAMERSEIIDGISNIVDGNLDYKITTKELHRDNMILASAINNISNGLRTAVEESIRNERMKTELITNVSHDIKTPLTSIINYVGLIKREEIENQRIKEYVEVLESKSQRLKHLTEDLVEASKISSGNIELQIERINFVELIYQTAGEFDDRFDEKNLSMVLNIAKEPVVVMADGRRVWRIIENLYNNVAKYALSGTRVYADLVVDHKKAVFSLKNISESQLNFQADELTERFIRGDVSRSTEGSGLGLSIAKNLTELQGGEFEIYVDGDLFRVTVTLPLAEEIESEENTRG